MINILIGIIGVIIGLILLDKIIVLVRENKIISIAIFIFIIMGLLGI